METIERMVIFSRHGLRYPSYLIPGALAFRGPVARRFAGRLTAYGRRIETSKGAWLRGVFDSCGFSVSADETEVCATRTQRTETSARCFMNGFFPGGAPAVSGEIDGIPTDGVFGSALRFASDREREKIQSELGKGYPRSEQYARDRGVLEKCLSMLTRSAVLSSEPDAVILREGHGPEVRGGLHTAALAADSLIHAHLVCPRFLNGLTEAEWQALARIADGHRAFIFGHPEIARSAVRPVIGCLADRMRGGGKRLTYVSCHDVNQYCLTRALGLEAASPVRSDYGAFPCGCMLLFTVFRNADGSRSIAVRMAYPEDAQILAHKRYTRNSRVQFTELIPSGMPADGAGRVAYEDFMALLESLR